MFKRFFPIFEKFVVFLVIFLATFSLPYNPDLGWHLRNGELIIRTKSIIQKDPFSHTLPKFNFVNHSWLTDVLLSLIHSRFGLLGMAVFSSFLLSLTLLIPFIVFKTSIFLSLFLSSVFCLLLREDYRGFQAQFLTLFFLSLLFAVWQKSLKKKKRLLGLPFVFLLWTNFHGGAPIGLFVLFVLVGGKLFCLPESKALKTPRRCPERSQIQNCIWAESNGLLQGGGIPLLSFLATLFNPAGIKYWQNFYIHLTDNVQKEYIVEWGNLSLNNLTGAVFLLASLITFFGWLSRFSKNSANFFLSIFFIFSAFFVRRNLPLFALFFVFSAFELWRSLSIKVFFHPTAKKILPFLVLLPTLIFTFPKIKREVKISSDLIQYCSCVPTFCPAEATQFLSRTELKGKMFNLYSWGGFLIWQAPKHKVFVDGRMATWKKEDFYPFYDHEMVIRLNPGWEKILEKYEISWAIIPANPYLIAGEQRDLASALRQKGWQEIYRDNIASVLKRE